MENANRTLQYQRAVTPTIDGGPNSIQSTLVRGKVLSYTSSVRTRYNQPNLNNIDKNSAISSSSAISGRSSAISPRPSATVSTVLQQPDINVQGKSTSLRSVGVTRTSASFRGSIPDQQSVVDPLSSLSMVQRHDLVPFTDDIPPDGIIFARIRNQMDSLVVFRTAEERQRNPERLNLDRRQLEVCPLLEQEQRLRLLNFQNNSIRAISNLENLPNLIFLDLYNNKISSLDGPLSSVRGLRVLMAGKNKISTVSNLSALRKLDVLDLHSNEIRVIEGLDGLADLRVLNLAGKTLLVPNDSDLFHVLTPIFRLAERRQPHLHRVQPIHATLAHRAQPAAQLHRDSDGPGSIARAAAGVPEPQPHPRGRGHGVSLRGEPPGGAVTRRKPLFGDRPCCVPQSRGAGHERAAAPGSTTSH